MSAPIPLGGATAVAAVLAVVAVLLWPRRRLPLAGPATPERAVPEREVTDPARWPSRARLDWRAAAAADPVEVVRRLVAARRRAAGAPGEAGDPLAEEVAAALVPCLEAGLPPVAALRAVRASVGPEASALLDAAERAAADGAPVGPHLAAVPALAVVGAAWSLSERLGAPLAPAVSDAAAQMRAGAAVRRAAEVAVAGPRASMGLLTLLPLAGPAVGLLLGRSPSELYRASPVTMVCLVVGALLTAGGWAWGRRIIDRALAPPSAEDTDWHDRAVAASGRALARVDAAEGIA